MTHPLSILLFLSGLLASCGGSSPERRLHDRLTECGATLATAESCTGGTIAARFTAHPGASAYFRGGVVAYCNEIKHKLLSVSADTLARYGAVSEPVARQMAEGVRQVTSAHYTIATTGLAGPSGGTPETPVGTVWIAISTPNGTTTRLIHATGSRKSVIHKAGTEALLLLEELLAQEQ